MPYAASEQPSLNWFSPLSSYVDKYDLGFTGSHKLEARAFSPSSACDGSPMDSSTDFSPKTASRFQSKAAVASAAESAMEESPVSESSSTTLVVSRQCSDI
jgi:hypothetical protein